MDGWMDGLTLQEAIPTNLASLVSASPQLTLPLITRDFLPSSASALLSGPFTAPAHLFRAWAAPSSEVSVCLGS